VKQKLEAIEFTNLALVREKESIKELGYLHVANKSKKLFLHQMKAKN